MNTFYIKEDYIKLNQLLKYIGLVSTGGEVKHFLEENSVVYNNQEVFELRKKIYINTTLYINEEEYLIVKES